MPTSDKDYKPIDVKEENVDIYTNAKYTEGTVGIINKRKGSVEFESSVEGTTSKQTKLSKQKKYEVLTSPRGTRTRSHSSSSEVSIPDSVLSATTPVISPTKTTSATKGAKANIIYDGDNIAEPSFGTPSRTSTIVSATPITPTASQSGDATPHTPTTPVTTPRSGRGRRCGSASKRGRKAVSLPLEPITEREKPGAFATIDATLCLTPRRSTKSTYVSASPLHEEQLLQPGTDPRLGTVPPKGSSIFAGEIETICSANAEKLLISFNNIKLYFSLVIVVFLYFLLVLQQKQYC